MDWTAPIDLYCERLGPGLWAEPLNALSNLAFLLAAGYALVALRQSGRRDPAVLALVLLVGLIGIGSLLFHVFANRWSVIADVLPITLFIYGYLALVLRRFLALSWLATAAALVAFLALNWPAEALLSPLLGGSAAYVPALAAMIGLGALLAHRAHVAGRLVLTAGGVFLVSLALRTLDLPLCDAVPAGTHYLWHILNAVTLLLLLVAAIRAPWR